VPKAIPHGVYGLAANDGFVSVGVDHDTAAFAVNAIRAWWYNVGAQRYSDSTRLLVTADAGGSNGYRLRAWKVELADLAAEIGRDITVAHYPSGASKWNKIEHRLFSFISINWRGRPLTEVRPSEVETLLVGGTVDFSTPPQLATDELLPALPNGHQVILAELGHATDFWSYQPEASTRLLTAYFDRGEVDDSRYEARPIEFEVGFLSLSTIAWILLGTLAGLALVAIVLLSATAVRVHRRGRLGSRASAWLRCLAPVVAGIGGWSLAVLVGSSLWPRLFIGDRWLAVVSIGIAAGLAIFGAWVHKDWTRRRRLAGLAAAVAGSLLGAWLGFHAVEDLAALVTTIAGATITANLALLLIDMRRDPYAAVVR